MDETVFKVSFNHRVIPNVVDKMLKDLKKLFRILRVTFSQVFIICGFRLLGFLSGCLGAIFDERVVIV